MMKPTTADELIRDPSKLSLTNSGGGGYHITRCVEVQGGEEDRLK